jgi:hypothetical protein
MKRRVPKIGAVPDASPMCVDIRPDTAVGNPDQATTIDSPTLLRCRMRGVRPQIDSESADQNCNQQKRNESQLESQQPVLTPGELENMIQYFQILLEWDERLRRADREVA